MFHIYPFFSRAFRMIKFRTVLIVAFYTSTSSCLLTNKTSLFESLFIYILNTFNVNKPILLFEVTLWNPYGTHIMHPYKMANWLISRICRFWKIIIIRLLLLSCSGFLNILLFVFVIWTLFCKFMVLRVCILEERSIYVNWSSFKCSSFHRTKRTGNINACWSEWCTNFTNPVISRNFCKSDASLMQTNVTHWTKDYKIIVSVITISTYLTLCVFNLPFSFLLLYHRIIMASFVNIQFLLPLFHVIEENFFIRVNLIY